uniref:ATP synthase subunit s, mitochondrial n=1 Tax=Steinernema glaseri TaxID=37863 RepID=A0A1I7YFQ0_9BILA
MSRFLVRQAGRFQSALVSHNIPGLQWLLEGFNYYDQERIKEVGPDRTAAEWIVRCEGKVRFDKIDEVFDDYNALIRTTAELDPRKAEDQVKLVSIDATGSSITAYGCRHFSKFLPFQFYGC